MGFWVLFVAFWTLPCSIQCYNGLWSILAGFKEEVFLVGLWTFFVAFWTPYIDRGIFSGPLDVSCGTWEAIQDGGIFSGHLVVFRGRFY